MKLSRELLKSILVTTPPEEDRRNFFVRLLSSIKVGFQIKRSHEGKTALAIRVRGGADF